MSLKAYKVWDTKNVEGCETVVFAETAREAKMIALATDACEDACYIDVRATRFPQMDKHYNGRTEIDWYNQEERTALVALGWMCLEISDECDSCQAREFCDHWKEADNEADL